MNDTGIGRLQSFVKHAHPDPHHDFCDCWEGAAESKNVPVVGARPKLKQEEEQGHHRPRMAGHS